MLRLELLRLQIEIYRASDGSPGETRAKHGESEVTGRISVGSDNPNQAQYRSGVPVVGVEPAGVLLDTGVVPFKRRLKHLSRNIRANAEVISYLSC